MPSRGRSEDATHANTDTVTAGERRAAKVRCVRDEEYDEQDEHYPRDPDPEITTNKETTTGDSMFHMCFMHFIKMLGLVLGLSRRGRRSLDYTIINYIGY